VAVYELLALYSYMHHLAFGGTEHTGGPVDREKRKQDVANNQTASI
jgi:hypothetical protein